MLVVVMAVYAGRERTVKNRLLGFTPHILLRHHGESAMADDAPMQNWEDDAEKALTWPRVQAATPYVADNAILDAICDAGSPHAKTAQRPVMFHGIDTEQAKRAFERMDKDGDDKVTFAEFIPPRGCAKPGDLFKKLDTDRDGTLNLEEFKAGQSSPQLEGITKMLDLDNYPESSADMGIDDCAVVSSIVAQQFGLHVGDMIRLYSTRNFEEVMRVYKTTEKPPLREAFAVPWKKSTAALAAAWQADGDDFKIAIDTLAGIHDPLSKLWSAPIRDPERQLLDSLLKNLNPGDNKDEAAGAYRFTAEKKSAIEQSVADLNATDPEKMDADALKHLKTIVLPKEAKVIGVYQASQMAVTPDLFVPLPLAQSLAGLDGTVQGIALRLDDAYAAEKVAADSRKALGPGWSLLTWGDQYQTFFSLINQQRVMMYFALSFIVLVSAFSMMAVMFTVTIQKRQEIGVMKALGAAPGQIVRVFLYQGMILGLAGAALGVGLGRLVVHFRGAVQEMFRSFGFDPFAASFTGFGVLPAHNNPLEQAIIGFLAFLLCSLAALVPAFFAARSDAAKSLRNL